MYKRRIINKIRQLAHWLELRDVRYISLRLLSLLKRYGITSVRAKKRAVDCVRLLAHYDCYPTFPTPGCVVSRNAAFCRELQGMGAELTVHGYDHVDFRSLSRAEASRQLIKAAQAFDCGDIQFEGFRCPYLSYTDDLLDAIPNGNFKYSSNKAIWWDVIPAEAKGVVTAIFDSLGRFYRAASSDVAVSTPSISGGLLEIPVSLPDDLQLYDGLKLGEEGITQAWTRILHQTHWRGELFNLLFHPELFQNCKSALESVLREARLLRPAVWVTQLHDINRWWREKSAFTVKVSSNSSGLHIRFDCSDRATVLIRNLNTSEVTSPWDGSYRVLKSRVLHLTPEQRPFVGALCAIPLSPVSFLREQGYIIDTSEQASRCGLYLDTSTLAKLKSQVQLIDYIESSPAPLIRFWRWPNKAKSALCVTGDLDALSLVDYMSRLWRM